MAEAALAALVIPGRAQWRGAAGPAHVRRFVVSRLAVLGWGAVGAVTGVWGFVGGAAFDSPFFWTWLACYAGLPVVVGLSQLLPERPSPIERYVLTDRYFVVESNRGCHAYKLDTLQDLTVELQGGLGRLLLRRHPDVSRELGWVMRLTALANGKDSQLRVVLADRLEDAPGLLRRIRAAQAAVAETSAPSAAPAGEVCAVASDIPQARPYEWGSLLGGITFAVVALLLSASFLLFSGLSALWPMLMILAVPGWYVWNGLRVSQHGLMQEGTRVMGEVTEVEQTDTRSDYWRVHYRYPLGDGASVSGKLAQSSFYEIERWDVGDLIEVRYDPRHPERHLARNGA